IYSVFNRKLNLKQPTSFNEKLQYLKLYDRSPRYTKMADKYEVRNYIADTIGDKYLIPLLGVYNDVNKINFDDLPNQFVLKCTHDSGGIFICKDKDKLDIPKLKREISKSLNKNYYNYGREWPYKNINPRIICEKYMVDNSFDDLMDYKFMCFN